MTATGVYTNKFVNFKKPNSNWQNKLNPSKGLDNNVLQTLTQKPRCPQLHYRRTCIHMYEWLNGEMKSMYLNSTSSHIG